MTGLLVRTLVAWAALAALLAGAGLARSGGDAPSPLVLAKDHRP